MPDLRIDKCCLPDCQKLRLKGDKYVCLHHRREADSVVYPRIKGSRRALEKLFWETYRMLERSVAASEENRLGHYAYWERVRKSV